METEQVTLVQTAQDVPITDKFKELKDDDERIGDQFTIPTDNTKAIAESILKGKAQAISDGSFKDAKGTAAWIITNEEELENSLQAQTRVPGNKED